MPSAKTDKLVTLNDLMQEPAKFQALSLNHGKQESNSQQTRHTIITNLAKRARSGAAVVQLLDVGLCQQPPHPSVPLLIYGLRV